MQLWSFSCIVKVKAAGDNTLNIPASIETTQKYKSSKLQIHKKGK